ncbi:MAG: DUF420 domain-containing protein [Halobacteriaceae archaeon]
MVAAPLRDYARTHPGRVTAVVSVIGYALVSAAFAGVIPLFPALADQTVILFGDLIAVINTIALSALLLGYYFVRKNRLHRHRAAMMTAFTLIVVFLVLYLWKVGGGFEKSIVITASDPLGAYADTIELIYFVMLAIHIVLSVVAVPVVLYAIILAATHDMAELSETIHPRVGRIAVLAWSLSLSLGILTYLLLNHVYGWEKLGEATMTIATAVPR